MSKKFKIALDIINVGPHSQPFNIHFQDDVDSNKLLFFARNGVGKTFISKSFRIFESERENTNDMITINKNTGQFQFAIIKDSTIKKATINFCRDQKPRTENNTGLIFHVFNSEYVNENIIPNHFTPDERIDGYILGKSNIDLTEEKAVYAKTKNELEKKQNDITYTINKAKNELIKWGVEPSTNEMKLFDKVHFQSSQVEFQIETCDVILNQLDKLKSIPENLQDIRLQCSEIDSTWFKSFEELVLFCFSSSTWDQEFVEDYNHNRNFIETGLSLLKENQNLCPFCKQKLSDLALDLIHKYTEYKNDKESQIVRQLEEFKNKLYEISSAMKRYYIDLLDAEQKAKNIREYFPSMGEEYDLSTMIDYDTVLDTIKAIENIIKNKQADLTITNSEVKNHLANLSNAVKTFNKIVTNNQQIVNQINKKKNDVKQERLHLRRKLCKAQYLKYYDVIRQLLKEEESLTTLLSQQVASIREKENQIKISKRDKVYETVDSCLSLFFNGKYKLDKESFKLNFNGNKLENSDKVLSDGEKSIVAFCLFLGMTHDLIKEVNDYERLFFIIDDPISSMDFDYVYVMGQLIRDLNKLFNIQNHVRLWVMTHNMEFFSIINRNHIIEKAYLITAGSIKHIQKELCLPYEQHLRDIVEIAIGQKLPNHTTANSIRHIIETVCKFEYPDKKISNYIVEDSILQSCPHIYTICQDLSHGNVNFERTYNEQILIECCKTVLEFMKKKYNGQVEALLQSN